MRLGGVDEAIAVGVATDGAQLQIFHVVAKHVKPEPCAFVPQIGFHTCFVGSHGLCSGHRQGVVKQQAALNARRTEATRDACVNVGVFIQLEGAGKIAAGIGHIGIFGEAPDEGGRKWRRDQPIGDEIFFVLGEAQAAAQRQHIAQLIVHRAKQCLRLVALLLFGEAVLHPTGEGVVVKAVDVYFFIEKI